MDFMLEIERQPIVQKEVVMKHTVHAELLL